MKKKGLFFLVMVIIAMLSVAGCVNQKNNHPTTTEPGTYDFSLVHDNLTRYYRVYVPPGYDPKVPTPVVIYFHGGGGNIRSAEIDGMNKQSDKHGFILVSPAGTGNFGKNMLSWNGGDWDCGNRCGYAQENNIDDVGFISQMIDTTEGNFTIDEKRIYATGISNGALMTMKLACDLSDKIAAFAPVALVAIPENCNPERPVSVMYTQGTSDPCTPFLGGTGKCLILKAENIASTEQKTNFWRARDKCTDNSVISYQNGNATCVSNTCAAKTEVELCTVVGMGHAWPSGSQYLSENLVGPVSYDISADQIWEFFQRNPMQ
jgi:polyhydroxybutyrate depolymerase